jgi:hypothetical protein
MQLVVTMGIRNLPSRPRPLQALYREYLEESVLAEELGFDAVWASEHHFSEDAWNPSPITFLAAVAARTERVRVGTYVLLLPFHNPVRVAEDIAVLDNISRCRSASARRPRSSVLSASRSGNGSGGPSRRSGSSSAASPEKSSVTKANISNSPMSA